MSNAVDSCHVEVRQLSIESGLENESFKGKTLPCKTNYILYFILLSNVTKVFCFNLHQVSGSVDLCVEDKIMNYLNRKDVQKALHARLVEVHRWIICSNILDYQVLNLEIPTTSIIRPCLQRRSRFYYPIYWKLLPGKSTIKGVRTGNNLPLPILVRREAGISIDFGSSFHFPQSIMLFVTIRGASREAPFSQPERSLMLFNSFLEGKPLPEVEEMPDTKQTLNDSLSENEDVKKMTGNENVKKMVKSEEVKLYGLN
ncbi:hypothetical protein GQ457_11G022880 [Hibiscus cannabinus]